MPEQSRNVKPGREDRTVLTEEGDLLQVPDSWELLPPGDAGMTRKVKQAGPSWTVQVRRGRRTFSQGIWAPGENIEAARQKVEKQRESPSYQRKLEQARVRRQEQQEQYVESFHETVLRFLDFNERYAEWAELLAKAVSEHATPVGSGTVARTKRIPVEQRAEAAVIAWMRHQTSAYDHIKVPRVKGARRELRRKISERSRRILDVYRRGEPIDFAECPLYAALRDEIRLQSIG